MNFLSHKTLFFFLRSPNVTPQHCHHKIFREITIQSTNWEYFVTDEIRHVIEDHWQVDHAQDHVETRSRHPVY